MAYLDNAATSYPKPACVYTSMDRFYRQSGGSAGRGPYALSQSASALTAETRQRILTLLDAPAKAVIFQPTATIAMNTILQGLLSDGAHRVYISPFEHNAVTRTLHALEKKGHVTVETLYVTQDLQFDLERIRYQFDAQPPDVVVVSHASNVMGLVAPVEAIFHLAKAFGAVTVVDMAQTCGLVKLPVGSEDIDFAVFAGHKSLLGPVGISGFVMSPQRQLPPLYYGGTGLESANPDMPATLPERFEAGTANILGIAGLHAALGWIAEQGVQNLLSQERQNRERLLNILKHYPFLSLVGNYPGREYIGIVSCLIRGLSADSAGSLFSQRDIAVRTGLHCAPLAHKFLGTFPAGTVRFSVNALTSPQDLEALAACLDEMAEEWG